MKYDQHYVALLKERIEIIEKRERNLYSEYARLRWVVAIVLPIAAFEFIYIMNFILKRG